MKGLKLLLSGLLFCMLLGTVKVASAQCAMCSTVVASNEKNGGTAANGLNHGIMYLLTAPYIAIAAIGLIWYKKYRRKNINLQMRDEKLNLN